MDEASCRGYDGRGSFWNMAVIVKKKIIYEEEIYSPSEFRTGNQRVSEWIYVKGLLPINLSMPAMLLGWTRGEMHVAFHYQGLQ